MNNAQLKSNNKTQQASNNQHLIFNPIKADWNKILKYIDSITDRTKRDEINNTTRG
jgi:hypothetical protein